MVKWGMSQREAECPAGVLDPSCCKMVLPKISVIMGPILLERSCGHCAKVTGGGVLLQEALSPQECPFRRDVPGNVAGVQTVAVEWLRQMQETKPLVQTDGQINVFPDRQLFVVPAHGVKAGFAKQ